MKLGIEVEKVEFHEFSDRLRVHGIIKEGPQDLGSYHTFNLESGDKLTIVKEKWKDHHLKRIEEAVKATDQPTSLFIAIDYDEATFAILRQSGPQELFHITSQVSGKQYKQSGDQKKTFYEEILSRLKQVMEEPKPVILVGPGFAKEEFIALAKEKEPELFENFIIAKDGKCAYGPNEVENALISGAVEILLLTDTSVREKRVEKLLKLAGETKVRIVIVSISHDAGKKLQALGDVGALLRYKMYT
jgi:protein pelota